MILRFLLVSLGPKDHMIEELSILMFLMSVAVKA